VALVVGAALLLQGFPVGAQPADPEFSSPDAVWADVDAMVQELESMQAEFNEADAATTRGNRLRLGAIELSRNLLDRLHWLVANDRDILEEDRITVWDILLTTEQVLGGLYLDTAQCGLAVETLERVLVHPESGERPLLVNRARQRLDEARRCVEGSATSESPVVASEDPGTPAPGPAPADSDMVATVAERSGSRAPLAVLLTGGALLLGGVVVDAAHAGDVSAFRDLRDTCYGPGCDALQTEQLETLQRRLRTGRAVSGTLYGVGVAAALTGVVMTATRRPDRAPGTARWSPVVGPGHAGVTVRWANRPGRSGP
jgi:hypothetical protein